MFAIETASRAGKISIFNQKIKGQKVNHEFLPEGIHYEDLTLAYNT